jgi:hypothetical protein
LFDTQDRDRRIAPRRERQSDVVDGRDRHRAEDDRASAGQRTATIQDKWFARLFLLKPLVIASLVLFWGMSGFIALVISFPATTAILTSHGFPPAIATPFVWREPRS